MEPRTILGIPLQIDLGTLADLATLAGVLGLGTAVEFFRRQMNKDEEARAQRQQQALEAYETHKEALGIHESLTSLEVLEKLELARAGKIDPAKKSFLISTYHRGNRRYRAFKDSVELPEELDKLVGEALEPIAALYPEELGAEHKKFEEKQEQRRTRDSTRYWWDDEGPHPKMWTINLIAKRWADTHNISSKAEFIASFGEELKKAVPSRDGEFNPDRLLTTDSKEPYLKDGLLLRLDGTAYGVWNPCGFRENKIGIEVHKPVIEYFRDTHGYPVRMA